MKRVSIFLLATAFSVSVYASQQAGSEPSTEPDNGPQLLRMTWEVNSCLSADTSRECFSPTEFRLGDRLHLREAETGNCSDPRSPVVLSFVQDNNRVVNIFFGCIVSDELSTTGRKLEIAFVDDPPGTGEGTTKMLTIQHVRVAGSDPNLGDCKQLLDGLSDSRLNNQAERVCLSRPFASLVHWKIKAECDADSDDCNGGPIGPFSPPDDGQGTASGND